MRDGRITKVPYYAPNRQAEADDASTWLPHDQAALIADTVVNGSGGGIGIELGHCGDAWIAGVDLDSCRNPVSGIVEPWASEVIDRLASYAEVSPSQTGVKQFFLIDPVDVPELRRIMGTTHGRQFKRADGGQHPPSIELYVSNRYFTVTWEGLANAPISLNTVPLADLRWLIEKAGPAFSGKGDRKTDGSGDGGTSILERLNTAAKHNKAIDTALRNAATMAGGSRSEGAFGLGAALKRAGWSSEDIKAALRACPATRDWAANADDRRFERIWHNSTTESQESSDAEPPKQTPNTLGIWDAGDDDYVIPPRSWLLGTTFCRRFLSSLIADGGVGKTALRLAQLVSLAIGCSLTGEHVFLRCRVLVVSLEDDADELRRRVYAVMRHHGITPEQLKGWLFLSAPKGLRLAEVKDGSRANGQLKELLNSAIENLKIDVVSLDPFIKTHGLEENSNDAIDYVCTLLAKMAIEHDCAVDLPHHTKKGLGGGAGDADRGRGASSMKDAARLVYTLNPMTAEEAKQFGVDETERDL
jgi:AAA domain